MVMKPCLLACTSGGGRHRTANAGLGRQIVELLVGLSLSVLLVRSFAAEAYVVPTGSMAPTLLGHHSELTCQRCRFQFAVGLDDEREVAQAVCPNCGQRMPDYPAALDSVGDRVLVQKFLYEFRGPKRWEIAVFHLPADPVQAFVKRVVGLPGEAIRISDGDVYVNGRIARKSLSEQRATRILVHDSRFEPRDRGQLPRWSFQADASEGVCASGWSLQDGRFRHEGFDQRGPAADDWLIYRHLDPSLGRYGPVTDFYAYNGGDLRGENEVADLGIEARVTVSESVQSLTLALRSGPDRFLVRIPVASNADIELLRNDAPVELSNCRNPFAGRGHWPRTLTLEASVFDRRVQVAFGGRLLFEPFDYESQVAQAPASDESPVALGIRGGTASVSELRIYRDIYYTSRLAGIPRQSQKRNAEVQLRDDEYFVLGDNSPVSNDSRFWSEGPVVRGALLVGKPFLVHLPGEVVPLEVLGRSVCRVPDPRRIRYIR
jgi:signal peptidase I